jgi:hypothetical protein
VVVVVEVPVLLVVVPVVEVVVVTVAVVVVVAVVTVTVVTVEVVVVVAVAVVVVVVIKAKPSGQPPLVSVSVQSRVLLMHHPLDPCLQNSLRGLSSEPLPEPLAPSGSSRLSRKGEDIAALLRSACLTLPANEEVWDG